MKKIYLIASLAFLFSGCLTHWVVESSTRLQLENHTSFALANLQIVSEDSSIANLEWMADTIPAGTKSRVASKELVGSFHLRISIADSICGDTLCWRNADLGTRRFDGGSIVWRVRILADTLDIEEK